MASLVDQIVVVDIESTCWKDKPPQNETSDIIQVGVVLLAVKGLTVWQKRSIIVKPERSSVSEFCTQLTNLTQEQVNSGLSFASACEILQKEYEAEDRLWASYGDYDRRMFEKCCLDLDVSYPFGPSHLNVKTLFATMLAEESEVGLPTALHKMGLSFEGRQHRGDDDAWNIARLLKVLFQKARFSQLS